jgi:hypothetical protein
MTTRQLSFRSCLVVSVRRCGCQCHSQDVCRSRQQLLQYFSWDQQPEVPTMYDDAGNYSTVLRCCKRSFSRSHAASAYLATLCYNAEISLLVLCSPASNCDG